MQTITLQIFFNSAWPRAVRIEMIKTGGAHGRKRREISRVGSETNGVVKICVHRKKFTWT